MNNKTVQIWPDDFDFERDDICQKIIKPFITSQMETLKAYDENRSEQTPDITYIFHEHAERVAINVKRTCLHLGLGEVISNNMYWAVLPHDIGKKNLPLDVWDTEEKPDDTLKTFRRTHTLLGAQIAQEHLHDTHHPFKDLMIDIMANHHEHMDGSGTHHISGDKLSLPVRLAAIVEAYDGYRIWRPHFGDRDISPEGVLNRMHNEKGAQIYDMGLLNAFTEMKMMDYKNGNIREMKDA